VSRLSEDVFGYETKEEGSGKISTHQRGTEVRRQF
jgi:hypothetical protein